MGGLNRVLTAIVAGLALSVVLAEAALGLFQFSSGRGPILQTLAAGGAMDRHGLLLLLGLIWLLAGAAGGAMSAGLSRCPWLALPVGLALGLPLAFTALVGMQPMGWVLALGLTSVLGALLAARAVQRLQQLDAESPPRATR